MIHSSWLVPPLPFLPSTSVFIFCLPTPSELILIFILILILVPSWGFEPGPWAAWQPVAAFIPTWPKSPASGAEGLAQSKHPAAFGPCHALLTLIGRFADGQNVNILVWKPNNPANYNKPYPRMSDKEKSEVSHYFFMEWQQVWSLKDDIISFAFICLSLAAGMHVWCLPVCYQGGIPNWSLSNLQTQPGFHVILLMSSCSFHRV